VGTRCGVQYSSKQEENKDRKDKAQAHDEANCGRDIVVCLPSLGLAREREGQALTFIPRSQEIPFRSWVRVRQGRQRLV
jgi:hypothetical protein